MLLLIMLSLLLFCSGCRGCYWWCSSSSSSSCFLLLVVVVVVGSFCDMQTDIPAECTKIPAYIHTLMAASEVQTINQLQLVGEHSDVAAARAPGKQP